MKIYTKTGDDGTTSLVGGKRVSKTDARLEAYGTVDELSAQLGLLLTYITDKDDAAGIMWIQHRLFSIGGCLATDTDCTPLPASCKVSEEQVKRLEGMIDAAEEGLPKHNRFILPGGSRAASVCHVARTVCRRAERCILALEKKPDAQLAAFMNRLSDYLFVLSRRLNCQSGTPEIFWEE